MRRFKWNYKYLKYIFYIYNFAGNKVLSKCKTAFFITKNEIIGSRLEKMMQFNPLLCCFARYQVFEGGDSRGLHVIGDHHLLNKWARLQIGVLLLKTFMLPEFYFIIAGFCKVLQQNYLGCLLKNTCPKAFSSLSEEGKTGLLPLQTSDSKGHQNLRLRIIWKILQDKPM